MNLQLQDSRSTTPEHECLREANINNEEQCSPRYKFNSMLFSPPSSSPQHQHQKLIPKIQSPNDDVKSAAIALTSLSLSPATGCLNSGYEDDVGGRMRFAFPPPHNTPTNETQPLFIPNASKEERVPPMICLQQQNMCGEVSSPRAQHKSRGTFMHYSPSVGTAGRDLCGRELLEILPSKPRSYSTSRDTFKAYYTPPQYEPLTKPRSYSFDAVGRSHKYFNDENNLEGEGRYHQQQQQHIRNDTSSQRKYSVDEGIGTSEGGSSDSLDTLLNPTVGLNKRKIVQRKGFRCMWRGCDKELSTLSGIILHVRHAHIGVERAGEEEFYFDDIDNNKEEEQQPQTTTEDDENNISYHKSKSPRLSSASTITIPGGTSLPESRLNTVEFPTIVPPQKQQHLITENKKINSTQVSVIHPVISAMQSHPGFTFTDSHRAPYIPVTSAGDSKHQKRRKYPLGKKKCRKVYGMTNKDLWCTQCRWKKACVRFL